MLVDVNVIGTCSYSIGVVKMLLLYLYLLNDWVGIEWGEAHSMYTIALYPPMYINSLFKLIEDNSQHYSFFIRIYLILGFMDCNKYASFGNSFHKFV